MIVKLFFLSIFFLLKSDSVKAFTHQFALKNNAINLDFVKLEPITDEPILTPSDLKRVLSFTYRIETQENLPVDIPIFIAAYDKKVIFSADASLADSVFHDVEIDLNNFAVNDYKQMPIFYQNHSLVGYDLNLINVNLINQSTGVKSLAKISDLNAIREKDDSLTIIFTLEEEIKNNHSYQLFCLDENLQIKHSLVLSQNDNFLWPMFSFFNLHANQKSELIFHLEKFSCEGKVYIIGDGVFESDKSTIIEVEDL